MGSIKCLGFNVFLNSFEVISRRKNPRVHQCAFLLQGGFSPLFSLERFTDSKLHATPISISHFPWILNAKRQKIHFLFQSLKRDPTQDWSSMSTSAVISGFSEFPFWRPGNRLTLVHTNQGLIRGAILIHYITGGSLNFSPDKASGPCSWWIVPRYLFLSRADDWSGEMRNHPFVICQLC